MIQRKYPVDIATNHTASFVTTNVPQDAWILEVGCGKGDVAFALEKSGYNLVGVDGDQEAVAAAKSKGLRVEHANWPFAPARRFDAVLFSRSLHHIDDLETAITAASDRLHPDGFLLIEDFAFDAMNAKSIGWFRDLLSEGCVSSVMAPTHGSFIDTLMGADDPAAAWKFEHDHDLHTFHAMTNAISKSFATPIRNAAPYLYRYLVPALPKTEQAAKCLADVFERETRAISSETIVAIGRRAVARKLK